MTLINKIINQIYDFNITLFRLRFAPEPGGSLHIGHLKSLYINNYIKQFLGGKLILRFDDTNPKSSKKKYIENINITIKKLKFLFFDCVTYSSCYFFRLYVITKNFLRSKFFYIDFYFLYRYSYVITIFNNSIVYTCDYFIIKSMRECFYILKKMRIGLYKEKEFSVNFFMVLNLFSNRKFYSYININKHIYNYKNKYILNNNSIFFINKKKSNYNNIAVRIKYIIHYSLTCKWFLYPSYNFSNSIIDRIELIDYSICTNEFKEIKFIYDLFINEYNLLYKKILYVKQIEIGKLFIIDFILSKRYLRVYKKTIGINNWNNIRLPTILGIFKTGLNLGFFCILFKHLLLSFKSPKISSNYYFSIFKRYITSKVFQSFILFFTKYIVIYYYLNKKQMNIISNINLFSNLCMIVSSNYHILFCFKEKNNSQFLKIIIIKLIRYKIINGKHFCLLYKYNYYYYNKNMINLFIKGKQIKYFFRNDYCIQINNICLVSIGTIVHIIPFGYFLILKKYKKNTYLLYDIYTYSKQIYLRNN